MTKRKLLAVILAAVSVGLAVFAYIILPETVIIQISAGASNSTAPKLLAVLIPTLLGTGGAVAALLLKDDKSARKGLILSAAGIALGILTVVINTVVK